MDTFRVVISGAERGLGLALCSSLARHGHTVYAGQYSDEGLPLQRLQEQYPGKVIPIALDCTCEVSIKNFVARVSAESNRLDILINNAAVLGDIETGIDGDLDFDEIQKVFETNALGPLRMIHACLPLLRLGTDKKIVYISSEAASISTNFRDRWFGYCMSKAALNRQAALIYEALKPDAFSVLCLHPGHLQTYMRGELDTSANLRPEDVAERLINLIRNPPKPFGFWDFEGKELNW